MKSLDRDLRERIVRAVERGEPMPRVAARFEVGLSTVKKLKYRHRDTGSTEPLTSRSAAASG
jgi:transposase